MVKITKSSKVPGGIGGFVSVAVGALFVLGLAGSMFGDANSAEPSRLLIKAASIDAVSNTEQMKAWRQNLRDLCSAATTKKDVDAISPKQLQGFTMPSLKPPAQPRGDGAIKRCKNVVMDFGANIGDTSGHVVDAGLISCEKSKELNSAVSHFNIETKAFEHVQKRNMLTKNLVKLMETQGSLTGPEDYCYYGIEGNPHFTERLQKIEDYVMAIRPRPIQHMHFFTESVGAGEDGMTKLYLDTINTKENFWGSSIFKDHQDVRKSAVGGDAETVASPVMGYTIGTLMRKTLAAYGPDNGKSHLVLKVDIEGGEYPLLHQAVEEGTLCDFCKQGNTADLFIEFHSARVTGKHDYIGKTKDMKEKLTACGVTFRNLAAWWA